VKSVSRGAAFLFAFSKSWNAIFSYELYASPGGRILKAPRPCGVFFLVSMVWAYTLPQTDTAFSRDIILPNISWFVVSQYSTDVVSLQDALGHVMKGLRKIGAGDTSLSRHFYDIAFLVRLPSRC